MSKSYEELVGAEGRERFFRPKRYRASELFRGAPPQVFFDDDEYRLENISISGAGCYARSTSGGDGIERISRRGVLRLIQHGEEIFAAEARQARADVRLGRLNVGFALEKSQFDLAALAHENARALAGQAHFDQSREAPAQEYKSYCADVLDFVGGYLQRIERHLAPIEQELSREERLQIVRELEQSAEAPWRRLLEAGNELVIPSHNDKKARLALKSFTERVVTRELLGGASWGRSYYKPMGYPGDYLIMNYMYDSAPVGDSIKENFLHSLGLIAGRPIVTRMETLGRLVADYSNKRPLDGEPIRIMSIGSGPAREIEKIMDATPPRRRWEATLVDQEPNALDYAVTAARRYETAGRLKLSGLNISFRELIDPSRIGEYCADHDIIYSAGLVDYLNPLLAMRFVQRMFEFLKPGGQLIIGNANILRTGTLWSMEYVLDWSLYFRNEDEMLAMASETPNAIKRVFNDPLDAIYFLVVEKPVG
ncbi:MAG: hypothetical protein ACE5FO_04940 [Parvularculaceae bacterium]